MIPDIAEALAARLSTDTPANVALMHLLIAASSAEAAAAALDRARIARPDLAVRLAAMSQLHAAHPGAWATVHAVAGGIDHAPACDTPEAALARWRDGFDRLAAAAPEAGVALYALGDTALLTAATAEVADTLRAWGLLGLDCRVLDLGCGIGRLSAALAPEVGSVLGLDLSPGMVAEARRRVQRANVSFALGTGRDLAGVAAEAHDLVLCADVFPYLVEADLADRHFGEIARVLRRGGAMVILNYSYRGDAAADGAEVEAAAARHGFAMLRAGERPFHLWDATAFHLSKRN